MNFIEEQKKAYDFFEESIVKNKKLSHAYLIETNNYSDYMKFIKYMIKSILCMNLSDSELISKIKLEVDNDNYPDIKYINPEGNFIKKEQLISLEKDFSKKSMLDNKLIYIINEADRLNDSSANTILKFLEEPEEDIIAILVTNNRYKVIDTICSRCQIVSLKGDQTESIDLSEKTMEFLKDLSNNQSIIKFDYYFEDLFSDKQKARKTLNILETTFFHYLNQYSLDEHLNQILVKYDYQQLIKYILIFNSAKNQLDYNVNMKLWFHYLLIELIEVK